MRQLLFKTFEWRLRLIEWRNAQAALLGTALIYPFMQDNHLKLNLSKIKFIPLFWKNFPASFAALQLEEIFCIEPSYEVRDPGLGVIMNHKLSLHSHAIAFAKAISFR